MARLKSIHDLEKQQIMAKFILIVAAISGALSQLFGAFGSHILDERLSQYHLGVYEIAVRYQFYNTFLLLGLGLLILLYPKLKGFKISAVLALSGMIIFSGSLYLLALTDTRWLGAVTPIGGVAVVAAWLLLAYTAANQLGEPKSESD